MDFLQILWSKILWLISPDTLLSAIGIAFALGLVIFIHEWGHFIACRMLHIKVEEFSIGFGKLLKEWKGKHGTMFSLRAIPLGGYVKPAGEFYARESEIKSKDEFAAKPWWARSIMVFAGAGMNYVLAFVIFFIVIISMGLPINDAKLIPPKIGEVMQGYPAASTDIKVGDLITKIDGQDITNWAELIKSLTDAKGQNITVTYVRGDEAFQSDIPLNKNKKIGIMVAPVYEKVSPLEALGVAAHQCYYWTALSITTIVDKLVHHQAPDVAGPIGIFEIVGKGVHSGWEDYFFLIGLISVAIGMFNLFPIPILDGGHILFFIIEGIRGKRVKEKTLYRASAVGATLLIALVLYATYNDIKRIRNRGVQPQTVAVETTTNEASND